MKILHITASYKPAYIYGGPIYSVAALCEAVEAESLKLKAKSDLDSGDDAQRSAERHHCEDTVQVYTTLANGNQELPYQSGETKIIEGVAVTYFKRLTKDHSHFSPPLLWQLWRNAKTFDIVHIHSWWNFVSMGAVLVCLLKGLRPILSPRGMLGDYTLTPAKRLFHRFVGRSLLKKCYFHATTAMEAEEIKKQVFFGLDASVCDLTTAGTVNPTEVNPNVFIIHNLLQLPEVLPKKERVFDGIFQLIFLSRIHHKKGIDILFEALAKVGFPFNLNVVGEAEANYMLALQAKAEILGISEHIKWHGTALGTEKFELLANADALVLPSYNENFANVVLESIAVGTPVLLSEHVGLKDYIRQSQQGLVFKISELQTCLEKAFLLFSEHRLKANPALIESNGILVGKYLEMYQQVCNCNLKD